MSTFPLCIHTLDCEGAGAAESIPSGQQQTMEPENVRLTICNSNVEICTTDGLVVPERIGGLGNQMFVITAANIYGRECNKELRIEASDGRNPHASSDYCDSIFKGFKLHSADNSTFRSLVQRQAFDAWECSYIPGNVRMLGYFQYYTPFLKYEEEIRSLFTNNIADVDTSCIDSKAVAIHVRRGDYLKLPEFYYIQSEDYYRHAMSFFPETVNFVIFSDDLDWCKAQTLFLSSRFSFIEEVNEVHAMAKMAAVKGGAICANSTFSWWSAFLGPHSVRAPVVVPASRWIALSSTDLFPSEWIRL
jgi:hypothetical protein